MDWLGNGGVTRRIRLWIRLSEVILWHLRRHSMRGQEKLHQGWNKSRLHAPNDQWARHNRKLFLHHPAVNERQMLRVRVQRMGQKGEIIVAKKG